MVKQTVKHNNGWIFPVFFIFTFAIFLELESREGWIFHLYIWAAVAHELTAIRKRAQSFNFWLTSKILATFRTDKWSFSIDGKINIREANYKTWTYKLNAFLNFKRSLVITSLLPPPPHPRASLWLIAYVDRYMTRP